MGIEKRTPAQAEARILARYSDRTVAVGKLALTLENANRAAAMFCRDEAGNPIPRDDPAKNVAWMAQALLKGNKLVDPANRLPVEDVAFLQQPYVTE